MSFINVGISAVKETPRDTRSVKPTMANVAVASGLCSPNDISIE